MTDSNDVLDRLDARAARARAGIDQALDELDVPAWNEPPPGDRRFGRRLLAAAVAVVAIVGGVLLIDRDDREPTVAGPGGITLLGLPDPSEHGYELVTAFDAIATSPGAGHATSLGADVVVQGRTEVQDPWSAVILDTVLHDLADPSGEPISLGQKTGVLTDGPIGGTVAWDTGNGFRYITSFSLGGDMQAVQDMLVDLAEAVIDQDLVLGDALPGHEVLHRGPMTDLLPAALLTDDPIPGTAELGYAPPDDPSAGFAVYMSPGSDARWRAASALADATRDVTVRGRDATLATTTDDLRSDQIVSELSWLEPDGTLVRMSWLGDRDMTAIANALEPLSRDEFAALVAEHAPSNQTATTTATEATPLTSIGLSDGPTHLQIRLENAAEGGSTVEFTATTTTGDTGAGVGVDSFDTNVALALPEHRAVAGLIGPALVDVRFFDSATGAPIDVIDSTIHHSEHSTHGMFIAVLDVDWGAAPAPPVEIVGTLEDGSEVRVTTDP